ncbi:hypothetical protein CCM_02012 [Cordyceps militaris CM01]|uniref:Uncharacterized protein n=1 Tax=Cordyceps militaris (strain CM01) TaxID=983644 RepID=G3JC25_CORMM|nr:uncharacterized protein CCM_02012 [Cordyceps militaris CM01]EGX93743.1 hypothetical protein CCM_02012 [Cordyceps militaris CM01]
MAVANPVFPPMKLHLQPRDGCSLCRLVPSDAVAYAVRHPCRRPSRVRSSPNRTELRNKTRSNAPPHGPFRTPAPPPHYTCPA